MMRPRSPIRTEGVTLDPEHLPEGEEKREAVRSLFDTIAPRYDLVNRIMTFGLDVRWRRKALAALDLSGGATVLDLACGTGDFCREATRAGLLPFGIDLSMGMLVAAQTEAPLVHGDILQMPIPDHVVDGATCGFALRNLVELPGFFDELARVVRPGGRISLLDAAQPENRLLRWGHGIYFGRVVPIIGGLLSDRAAYEYLPKSLAYMPPWHELRDRIEAAGFRSIERRVFIGAHLITATREGEPALSWPRSTTSPRGRRG